MADMGIPPPPSGYTMDGGADQSAPPPPPNGFKMDNAGSIPPPPSGFRVDGGAQPQPHDLMSQIGHDIHGAFTGAMMGGFGGLVARHLYTDVLGVPKDRVNAAVQSIKQEAAQEQQDNALNINVFGHPVDPVALGSGFVGGADPTLAIPIPGIGAMAGKIATKGLANYAAHVGVSAAAHGALGSASDAAYQGADMLDGLQKDFDVNRNLHAAMGMAALGGAGTAVSPFVRNLFKERNGIDTTPTDHPTGTTNPLSGPQGMTPEQLSAYHDVLQTGNQADIHNFFDDKNIQPPTHATINEWVNRRDAMNQGTPVVPEEGQVSHNDLTNNMLGTPDLREAVTQHIQEQTKDWKNAPEYEVINHTDDIADPAVREAAVKEGADNPNALGFLGQDGKVRVFASKVDSPETLNAILYHESLGHFGLAQKFGDKLDDTITTLMQRNVGQFGKDVDAWQKQNPGAYNGDRVRAGEEVLANMSNNGTLKPSLADALDSHVRNFGRKMGMKLSYNDGEVRQIMSMAHDAVINGKGRDVVSNGFAQSKSYQPMDMGRPDVPPPGFKIDDQGDGFMTHDQIAHANSIPTTAEHEAVNGPVTTQPVEPVAPYIPKDQPHIAEDGFATPEQLAEPQGNPRFMLRSDLEPKDVSEEAYERLNKTYVPTKRTWEQTAALAKDTALSPEMIRATRGVGNLDRKMFVYDAAAKEANAKLMALHADGPLTAEDHATALETAAHFNYVLGRIENDASQIARGLNAMKAVRFSRNNLAALKQALADSGTNMEELADPQMMLKFLKQYQKLAAGGNPNGAANHLMSVTKPYWWQYLLSYRQNMMLSALSTHLKSTMDMGTMIGRELQESTLAMPGAAVRETLRSLGVKNIKPGAHPVELAARVNGLLRAALEARTYNSTAEAFKNGTQLGQQTPWANGGIEQPRIPFVSKVSDLISAQDTFFRSFLTNQNLHALGTREAYAKLKMTSKNGHVNWDDAMTDGAARARNPTKDMMDEARELTENTILMNKSPMNAAIDKARAITPGMNGYEQAGSFFANLLTPFIRVGSNALMNQIVRRSPLAFLDPVTRADFKAGGARADIAVARIAMGTALLGYYWNASDPKKDKVIGEGPANRSKLLEKQAGGFAANSIHENGRYNTTSNLNISLNPLDLHNNVATMVAGMREAYETGTANAGQTALGIKLASVTLLHSLANQSFIADLGETMDQFIDKRDTTGQKIAKFAGDMGKSFLPNQTNQLARIADPNKHDTISDSALGTISNTLQASVPGLTGNVPTRYNVYGQPAKTGTDILGVHNWITQGNGQNETTDPTEKELERLGGLTKAAIVTPTQRTVKVAGANLKLNAAQAEEYQKYAGQTIVQAVRDQMQSGSWDQLSEQDRVNYVRSVQTQAKKEVRETLLQQPGWLTKDQLSNLRSQLGGK